MKKNLIIFLFVVIAIPSFAQTNAVTEDGDKVVLYDDGTWEYADEVDDTVTNTAADTIIADEIPLNSLTFSKNEESNYLLKSERINIGCWVDTAKWSINKAPDNEAAEFEINHRGEDLYGMMITEKLDLPLESLANIALDNARDAAPDVKVLDKQYRYVNGIKVLMMRMTGTIQGIKFSYYGYYYSTGNGATQFLVYSSVENVDKNMPEIESLLNGLVQLNN